MDKAEITNKNSQTQNYAKMNHANISIFIPHAGCPYRCVFCDQRSISGAVKVPTAEDVRDELESAVKKLKDPSDTEIAYFGGSFTCLPRQYMMELLTIASEYVNKYKLAGIRLSTRPDAITPEMVKLLADYGVTAIELGAQSMDDAVLEKNKRGHTRDAVINAVKCIREHFRGELGLQMMTGMAGASAASDMATAQAIARLAPDTVRIYPSVVIAGTAFDELRQANEYNPIPFDEMVNLVADMLLLFESANIRVIRVGLHASTSLESEITGGFYHPAFGELVESELFRRVIEGELREKLPIPGSATVFVNPKNISKSIGQHRKNIDIFQKYGYDVKIRPDSCLPLSRAARVETD
jgi:histone acetyltransferase (RNA polymerase elongator complex component)